MAEKKSLRFATPAPIRTAFRLIEKGAPPVAVRLALWLFCRPKRRSPRPAERGILARAARVIPTAGPRLRVHVWGEGPLVLLHHGWNGSAAQMSPLADRLAHGGYRVAVLDARGHGESPGRQANLPWMGDDLARLGAQLGPVHALVGHSMGAMVCARAMQQGLDARRIVMISAPAEIMPYLRYFQRSFAISDRTIDGMISLADARFGLSPAAARADALAAGRKQPLLLLHDRQDPDVPARHPETWCRVWPDARLEWTDGLGHRRILRDEETARRVGGFLDEGRD